MKETNTILCSKIIRGIIVESGFLKASSCQHFHMYFLHMHRLFYKDAFDYCVGGSGLKQGVQLGSCWSVQVREDDGWTRDGCGDGKGQSDTPGNYENLPVTQREMWEKEKSKKTPGCGVPDAFYWDGEDLGTVAGDRGRGAGRSWGSASKCQVEDAYSVCTLISAVPAPLKYKILNSQRKNMKSFLFMKTKYKITINCHPK